MATRKLIVYNPEPTISTTKIFEAGESLDLEGSVTFNGSVTFTGSVTLDSFQPKLNNLIFVETLADLPTPVSSVITLQDSTLYQFANSLDLVGNRLVLGLDTSIQGTSITGCVLTSTGLGSGIPLITTTSSFYIRSITISGVDTAFSASGSIALGNTCILDHIRMLFVNNIGEFSDYSHLTISYCGFLYTGNLNVVGDLDTFSLFKTVFVLNPSSTGISVPSGISILSRIQIVYCTFATDATNTALDIEEASIASDDSLILEGCIFTGAGSYLLNVDYLSNKAYFYNNHGISNSANVCSYYMNNNATTSNIISINSYIKVAGTTTSGPYISKFTLTNNRATYTGSIPRFFKVTAVASVNTFGSNRGVGVGVAKNGTLIPSSVSESIATGSVSSGRYEGLSVQDIVNLENGDYVEIFVANLTGSQDYTVTELNVILHEI